MAGIAIAPHATRHGTSIRGAGINGKNHSRQRHRANLNGRLLTCRLPLNKARPAQALDQATQVRQDIRSPGNRQGPPVRVTPPGGTQFACRHAERVSMLAR